MARIDLLSAWLGRSSGCKRFGEDPVVELAKRGDALGPRLFGEFSQGLIVQNDFVALVAVEKRGDDGDEAGVKLDQDLSEGVLCGG